MSLDSVTPVNLLSPCPRPDTLPGLPRAAGTGQPRVPSHTLAAAALVALVTLAGCASRPNQAPVEDRSLSRGSAPSGSPAGTSTRTPARPAATAPAPAPAAPAAAPAASRSPTETAPVPASARPASADTPVPAGFYAVKPGDTLGRIALDHGQGWRDLARWNGIENPNLIEVGQLLRVAPPGSESGAAVTRPVPPVGRVETKPGTAGASAAPGSGTAGTAAPVVGITATPATPATTATPAPPPATAREGDEDVNWAWPAAGSLLAGFDEARSVKGLSIGGKPGDPVLAAADGRVVYAGNGLRGYGNLVIVKHNATYLTAYAHNQALLVKEDQVVRRGQKIAEMGSSDSDSVRLHFEVRRNGRPVDPARLLPPR
ncbi:MAG: peptidoglycan DD-metalloendopeptidase family protein [Rubrivivax sp.]